MLWFKAFHIIFVVAWFAGLFYLPRLFVYHIEARDEISRARFIVMESRLFAIMTIGALLAVLCGGSLVMLAPGYLQAHWLHLKLGLVLLLLGYHLWCWLLVRDFRHARAAHSARWYRLFNEVPALLLIAIVLVAVFKP